MKIRIGHGYDVHKLTENRALILGGVKIPHNKGLLGHSDADVLSHSITDAILGAAALGDIGKLFPDSDSVYENADSVLLLKTAYTKVREAGYVVGNIDATIVAQAPKLSPFIEEIRGNIATALKVPIEDVSVKATSEEGLGFTGEGLGIAAHSVVLLVGV